MIDEIDLLQSNNRKDFWRFSLIVSNVIKRSPSKEGNSRGIAVESERTRRSVAKVRASRGKERI